MTTNNNNHSCSHLHLGEVELEEASHIDILHGQKNPVHCGACKQPILGKSFNCTSCNDFHLHPLCKACPPFLSSCSLHPQHTLARVAMDAAPRRFCDVCSEGIDGVSYSCAQCNFDVHPLCSQLPRQVCHVLDPHHFLQLHHRPMGTRICNVCRSDCGGWGYRCQLCSVDVHYRCLLQRTSPPPPDNSQQAHQYRNTQDRSLAPPSWHYGYGGGGGPAPPAAPWQPQHIVFGANNYGYGYGAPPYYNAGGFHHGYHYQPGGNHHINNGNGGGGNIGAAIGLGGALATVGSLAINIVTSIAAGWIRDEFFAQ